MTVVCNLRVDDGRSRLGTGGSDRPFCHLNLALPNTQTIYQKIYQ